MSTKNKSIREELKTKLETLGLDPKEIAIENEYEVVVPKMALLGVFSTLESFTSAAKMQITSSPGPINVRNLLVFIGAIKSSMTAAEKILSDYQDAKLKIKTLYELRELEEQDQEQQNTEHQNLNNQELSDEGDEDDDDKLYAEFQPITQKTKKGNIVN